MKQMLKRKHDMEKQLNDEQTKRIKLDGEVRKLNHTSRQQSLASKAWSEYSRQQKYNKKKSLPKGIHVALGLDFIRVHLNWKMLTLVLVKF